MTIKKKIFLSFLIAFAVVGLSPFAFDQIVARHYLEILHETKINTKQLETVSLHYPQFKNDVALLMPIIEFMNGPKLRDAGPYLNPRSQWDSAAETQQNIQAYERQFGSIKKFVISLEAMSALDKFDGPFLKLDPRQFADVDTKWLHKLQNFDHWDLDKNSPIDLFPRFSYSTPMPNFHLAFTKIHLLKVQSKNDTSYLQAVRDVIRYGELALSTETMIGEMVFVSTLNQAHEALNLRAHLRQQMGPWKAVLEERARLKRVYWAVNQYARPSLQIPSRIWHHTYLDSIPAMGICASIRESTAVDWPSWAAMTDVMPKQYKDYRQLISENTQGCRLTWIKEKTPAWVKLPTEPNSFYSSTEALKYFTVQADSDEFKILKYARPIIRLIEFMPQTRQLIGTLIASIGQPNYTKLYDKKNVSEKSVSRKVTGSKVATTHVNE